jgi:hypothetical protein
VLGSSDVSATARARSAARLKVVVWVVGHRWSSSLCRPV